MALTRLDLRGHAPPGSQCSCPPGPQGSCPAWTSDFLRPLQLGQPRFPLFSAPSASMCGHVLQQLQDPNDRGFLRVPTEMGHSWGSLGLGSGFKRAEGEMAALTVTNPSDQAREPLPRKCA